MWSPMKELFILMAHVLTTLVKLAQPRGVRQLQPAQLVRRGQRARDALEPVAQPHFADRDGIVIGVHPLAL